MKCINTNQLTELLENAQQSPRRRMNLNMHLQLSDGVQRFFNAMLPETYVRPHRHEGANRWELFLILSGEALALTFDDDGRIVERQLLSQNAANIAVEIPGDTWHALVSLQNDTVLFECKTGPYQPVTDKNFANWAPDENSSDKQQFIDWYRIGEIGSSPPGRGY